MIDDFQEQIRGEKARIKHLRNNCRIWGSIQGSYHKIRTLDSLMEGCKTKRDRYMAENRRLRGRVAAEKYNVIFEDDREVIQLDSDEDDDD